MGWAAAADGSGGGRVAVTGSENNPGTVLGLGHVGHGTGPCERTTGPWRFWTRAPRSSRYEAGRARSAPGRQLMCDPRTGAAHLPLAVDTALFVRGFRTKRPGFRAGCQALAVKRDPAVS